MRNVIGTVLLLFFVLLTSAQVPKQCSAPLEYPHTILEQKYISRQKFSHNEKVYYRCEEDFIPYRGVPKVQCVDGAWTKLTLKCEKRSCGNAGELPNGQFIYEGNSYIGERVYAECNEGYTLKGLNYLICKKSGWTGEVPTCEEGQATCSSPTVANSVSSGRDVSVYQLGENVNFSCSLGFQLEGAQRITCGPGGQWQPELPRCLPKKTPEKEGGCGVPQVSENSNANLADKYIMMTSFSSGDKVYYMCDIGYVAAGGSRYRRCSEGKWSPLRLKCERWSCGSAGEIANGQFIYKGVLFGDTATAVCDEGFHLVGQAHRICMSTGWDGRVPVCEAVTCEAPPPVINADMIGSEDPPYTYRRVIQYQCRVGVLTGKREIWCTKDGTWSHPPPTCKEITCPPPNVRNAYWTHAQKKAHQPRDTVMIQCKRGYIMSGPDVLTCGTNGQWSPFLPQCTGRSRRIHHRG
ncbi:complement receptor type 1 [Cheilinus undulatus]|uniref:complement receptor type 1 n=1 Tax=Cheilinus undulatus TaxID=241271 RepID=UPI001BD410DE|nr:complement receptor type 1 [Cheilinus undulatus]